MDRHVRSPRDVFEERCEQRMLRTHTLPKPSLQDLDNILVNGSLPYPLYM